MFVPHHMPRHVQQHSSTAQNIGVVVFLEIGELNCGRARVCDRVTSDVVVQGGGDVSVSVEAVFLEGQISGSKY